MLQPIYYRFYLVPGSNPKRRRIRVVFHYGANRGKGRRDRMLNIYIEEKYWSQKNQKSTGRDPYNNKINEELLKIRHFFEVDAWHLFGRNEVIRTKKLAKLFDEHFDTYVRKDSNEFTYYVDKFLEDKKSGKGGKLSYNRQKTFVHLKRYLEVYKSQGNSILIDDIDKDWLIEFGNWLAAGKQNMKTRMANTTIKMGVFGPILHIIKRYTLKHQDLNVNEYFPVTGDAPPSFIYLRDVFRLMNDVSFEITDETRTTHLYKHIGIHPYQVALDAFIFCCFTGLRYEEVKNASMKHIHNRMELREDKSQYDNYKVLNYHQTKTKKKPVETPLNEICLKLIEKYDEHRVYFSSTLEPDRLFPVPGPAVCNTAVKEACKRIGMNQIESYYINYGQEVVEKVKPRWQTIKFHSSRHTFASYMLQNGASLKLVQTLLGHTQLRTTEIYAKFGEQASYQGWKIDSIARKIKLNEMPLDEAVKMEEEKEKLPPGRPKKAINY